MDNHYDRDLLPISPSATVSLSSSPNAGSAALRGQEMLAPSRKQLAMASSAAAALTATRIRMRETLGGPLPVTAGVAEGYCAAGVPFVGAVTGIVLWLFWWA